MRIWSIAKDMAAKTPEDRNRYVDFLRAVSILVVVLGHWLIATAYYNDGEIAFGHLLKEQPQTHWLTWIFQVMPIFFIVGGYSNAVSLESANRKGTDYAGWLVARLNRLVAPLLVLLIAWGGLSLTMKLMGVSEQTIQYASQASLIPTWFLAIYIIVVILAPWTYKLWRRFGFLSFWGFVGVAAFVDYAYFNLSMQWLGWSNYFWVWLAVSQLGFAWRDGKMGGPGRLLVYAALGFAALFLLITEGPYPMAMVGSPDPGLSNTLPPKVTLVALGVFQFGLLLSLEGPMRAALSGLRLWAATVLINSMIMTVYLWHITVMIVVVSLLYLSGGLGLGVEPGTEHWWLTRPGWLALLIVVLVPIALLMSTFERMSRRDDSVPSAWRQIPGALMICLGVALLAMFGYAGGPQHLDFAAFFLVIGGAALSGLLPSFRK